jgi:6-phosphogluconolactonase
MNKIYICNSPVDLARHAAELFVAELEKYQSVKRFQVALSGGSTPKLMYDALAKNPSAGGLLKEKAEFYFSDERTVGPQCEQSNFRLAKLGLFEPLGIEEIWTHRIMGESSDLNAEANRYEALLRDNAVSGADGIPSLDLVFLGMGPDGHTASLFPDFYFEAVGERLVMAPWVSSQKSYRVTFTPRLINKSRKVLFLVGGGEKREAVTKVLSRGIKGGNLPARRIAASETIWLLDREAAGALDRDEIDGTIIAC